MYGLERAGVVCVRNELNWETGADFCGDKKEARIR